MARYRDATAATVKQAVARYLDTKNRLLVRFRVEKSGRASEAALDRSKEPASGADKPFQAPTVETAKLPNGMDLFVVQRPELPKVAITFVTRAGAEADPAGQGRSRPADGHAARHGDAHPQGARDRGRAGRSRRRDHGRRRARERPRLLRDAQAQPRSGDRDRRRRHPQRQLPASEFDREKKRQLDTLAQQDKNANAVGARVRAILAFGPDHPYGRPVQGLPSTIEKLTREDLAKFHADVLEAGLFRARRLAAT